MTTAEPVSQGVSGALDLVIEGASEIFLGDGNHLTGAVVAVHAGHIAFVGTSEEFRAKGFQRHEDCKHVDASGCLVTPGLVDPHTHVVFGGERSNEYAQRATGASYLEIAASGGGIASTMRSTRAASHEELFASALPRLDQLVANGVTTAEVKSGYGLSFESELKLLKVIASLDATHPLTLVPTFLGAHTVPPDRREDRERYLDEVVNEMIPAVAEAKLARFCDVFVEKGAFSIDEAERVLLAGRDHGMAPKVHADQLSPGLGAELAARVGAVSADHLEHISDEGIRALAEAGVVAVLLPGAALFLGADDVAPARRMIEAGVEVALSTDCNPGTCMTENLLLMLTLGMSRLKMSPSEVLCGVTRSAAKAIGEERRAGILQVGRPADIAIFDVSNHHRLPYFMGRPHAHLVFKAGRLIYERLDGIVPRIP